MFLLLPQELEIIGHQHHEIAVVLEFIDQFVPAMLEWGLLEPFRCLQFGVVSHHPGVLPIGSLAQSVFRLKHSRRGRDLIPRCHD